MSRVPRRIRERLSGSERRVRLIQAAIEVFSQRGYEGASVEEIAEAASVTKPVLYDHFSSKENLFVAAIEQIRDGLLYRGNTAVEKEKTPSKKLKAAILVFFDLAEEDPCAARVLLISSKAPAPIADTCRRIQAAATSGLAQIMRSHSPSSAADWGHQWLLKAEFIKKGMHGLTEWWLEHPKVPRLEIEKALFGILNKGVGLR
ncbi:MAG TPA: helix-turn-helix domain-containing protein [Verrucomicrobiae bacterium]|nr:helix-turn-helix domain-containing protein [Verrucomicrobiae bacterium]